MTNLGSRMAIISLVSSSLVSSLLAWRVVRVLASQECCPWSPDGPALSAHARVVGASLTYAFVCREVTTDTEAPHIKAVLGEISVMRNVL